MPSPLYVLSGLGHIASAATVIPVIAIVFVSLRLYIRIKRHEESLAVDDYLQPASLLFFIGMCICSLIGISHRAIGYATPPAAPGVTPPTVYLNQKLMFASKLMEILSSGLIKISALWFYRRIFLVHRQTKFDNTIILSIVVIICWMIAFIIYQVLRCPTRVSAGWSGAADYIEYCGDRAYFYPLSYSITAIVFDTIVLLIPIPSIWGLRLTLKRKIGITLIFLLALIGYGAGMTRVVGTAQATFAARSNRGRNDIQLQNTTIQWYNIVEVGLSIIAVNAVIAWQLFSDMTKNLHGIRSLLGSHQSSLESMKKSKVSESDEAQRETSEENSEKTDKMNNV